MATKDLTKLVMPSGVTKDGSQNDTTDSTAQEAAEQTTGGDNIQQEAQELYDEVMGDNPEVCKALYELLKDKYEGEEKTTKKEVKAEAKGGQKDDDEEEYNTEGMD